MDLLIFITIAFVLCLTCYSLVWQKFLARLIHTIPCHAMSYIIPCRISYHIILYCRFQHCACHYESWHKCHGTGESGGWNVCISSVSEWRQWHTHVLRVIVYVSMWRNVYYQSYRYWLPYANEILSYSNHSTLKIR